MTFSMPTSICSRNLSILLKTEHPTPKLLHPIWRHKGLSNPFFSGRDHRDIIGVFVIPEYTYKYIYIYICIIYKYVLYIQISKIDVLKNMYVCMQIWIHMFDVYYIFLFVVSISWFLQFCDVLCIYSTQSSFLGGKNAPRTHDHQSPSPQD